tara:strand:- start:2193 stop:2762 length:570 start_codon:yes stop_codon:yes gene_type:complete
MCFSFEVSLGTFVFSWSSALYLLKTKTLSTYERHDIIKLLIFSSIQLLDAILWWNKMRRNNINYIVTSYLIPAVLAAQVIYNIYFRNNINNLYLNIFVAIYVGIIFIKFHGYSNSLCDNYFSSPIWGGNELTYWELVVFLILIVFPDWNLILVGMFAAPVMMHIFKGGYGSMWCTIANFWAIYYLYAYS